MILVTGATGFIGSHLVEREIALLLTLRDERLQLLDVGQRDVDSQHGTPI